MTGGGGFLGRYIVEMLLARGDRVRSFSRRRYPALDALGVESVTGDLRNAGAGAAACTGVDVVFHVAAAAGVWGAWRHYYEINTQGTDNVIAGCQEHGVGGLVYTSSPSVTFDGTDQCGVDESEPYPRRWLCHYSHSKALAEQAVLAANGQAGLLACSLRPHLIWGPRDNHLVPRLIARARAGRLRRVGDGHNLIDMAYVENAALAHLQAADALRNNAATAGRAYFISQGQPVNCWQWIDEMLSLAGLPKLNKSISAKAAWRVGAILEVVYRLLRIRREPPMTRFLALQLSASHYFNIRRAKEDFGYDPQVSTAEGMRRLGEELRRENQDMD